MQLQHMHSTKPQDFVATSCYGKASTAWIEILKKKQLS